MRWIELGLVGVLGCTSTPGSQPDASNDAQPDDALPSEASTTDAGVDAYVPTELVHRIGRFDTTDPKGPRFAYPGSAIGASFQGTGVSAAITEQNENYFDVIIDGVVMTPIHTVAATTTYVLAQFLQPALHTVWIVKRTESFQGIDQFGGFAVSAGALVASPIPHPHRIEMIGDSITCGYGDLGQGPNCSFSPDTENENVAWGAVAAQTLGASHTAIAYSGKGMARNNDGSTTDLMPTIWLRTFADDPTSTWDFTKNIPDVVVINLGTNDFAQGDPGAAFTAAYSAFLVKLRATYPNAYIVCVVGPMLSGTSLTAAETYVKGVVQSSGDAKVSYLELPTQTGGYGCDYHPTTATQSSMGAALAAHITSLNAW